MRFLISAEIGFFAAILTVSMVGHWIQAIAVVLEKHWTYGDELIQRRTLLWALPIVLTLHSGPWFIVVLVIIGWQMFSVPHAAGLTGALWGFLAGILLMASLMCFALVKVRRTAKSRHDQQQGAHNAA